MVSVTNSSSDAACVSWSLQVDIESRISLSFSYTSSWKMHYEYIFNYIISMFSTLLWLPDVTFLPRCMQCGRGLAMRILSVCLSVRHTRALWQNCRKIFPDLYTVLKIIYPTFLRRRTVGGGRPLLREILGRPIPVGMKSTIFNQ